jgi:hypothetical protein
METTFTKVGGDAMNWERLRPVPIVGRYLYWGLYVSHRRALIGLWNAGLPTIADAAKMAPDDALAGLDALLEHDLVEYDRHREVLRLTELPDRCERPQNPSHLQSIWTRFRAVPACQVRDAHVRTLEWLIAGMDEAPKPSMVEQWGKTFGTIPVPAPRKRGVRRLLDSDTSTSAQPSLFTNPSETVVLIAKQDTVSDTVSDTLRSTIYDLGSSSSDLGESKPQAIHLGLVPLSADPFTATEMLEAVAAESHGRFAPGPVDERLHEALSATIRACVTAEVGLPDLRVVGKWLAAGGLAYRSDLGPLWIAKAGELLNAVGLAKQWQAGGGGAIGPPARRLPARVEPTPVGVHGTGRRRL